MNSRQLSYFIEVYKTRSIKKAAEKFFISTQGMSKTIINLEAECGHTLFERNGNVLTPTAYAEFLLPHAYKILEEYSYIESSKNYFNKLCVCTIDGLIECLPEGFLNSFFQNHPEINLEINETTHDNAVEQLTSDGCDLALLQVPYHAPGYVNEFVFSYGFCMGINKESPLSHEKEFLPAFWDGQNIAARGYKYPVFANYVKGLNSQGIYPRVILESNNDRLLLAQAEQNTAIACVSEYVARAYHGDDIAFVPINDSASRDMVYLCYRQYKEENCEGLRIFRAFLKQYTL